LQPFQSAVVDDPLENAFVDIGWHDILFGTT
jgi:hypothetical protein